MSRYQPLNALLIVLALIGIAQAQESRQAMIEEAGQTPHAVSGEQPVFDDDGGRVFIVKRNAGALDSLRYHGGLVISQPQQYNIFLGNAWSEPSLQKRESAFSRLLSEISSQADPATLERYGVKTIFLPSVNQEQSLDFSSDQTVSDLRIRALLEEMLRTRAVQGPDANAIYVVFLPPGISSKLGEMIGGKHYTAYHNFFHAEQGEIHYVVVPFESNRELAKQSAARAVIEAMLNPTGNGWY